MDVTVFLDIALCSPYINRRFGEKCYFYLQSKKLAKQVTSVQEVVWLIWDPGDAGDTFSETSVHTGLQNALSQNTATLILNIKDILNYVEPCVRIIKGKAEPKIPLPKEAVSLE
jgi:hypothetical protein